MNNTRNKEKMSTLQLIAHMKGKGITFELCDEAAAETYLRTKNDYFRVSAFRKLFAKHNKGKQAGRYIDLDFDYLKQLSYVDQSLRALIREMSLNVEHYQKVFVLDQITNNEKEDGYSIVSDFEKSLSDGRRRRLNDEIEARSRDLHCGEIISHYKNRMPAWAFFEVISFGTFVDFCRFCSERWGDRKLKETHHMLRKAKSLRNAAAHGACIINGFSDTDDKSSTMSRKVENALGKTSLSKQRRKRWLSNPRMREIVTLMYLASRTITEGESKRRTAQNLKSFFEETERKLAPLPDNNPAVAGIDFMKELTDSWNLG